MKQLPCILLLPLILGLSFWNDVRARNRAAALRASMAAEVHREVLLAIERQDFVDLARRTHPSLTDNSSPLYRACVARWVALVEDHSPLLERPDWPLTVADEEAARLGLSPTIVLH